MLRRVVCPLTPRSISVVVLPFHHLLFRLYWASSEGRRACVKVLIDRGANPTLEDRDGNTAAAIAEQNGHIECHDLVKFLVAV